MTWPEYIALLTLATAMSFSPGPNTTLSTALAANRGLRGALHFVASVPVGWGLLLLVCAFGVGSLVLAWPPLGWAVKIVGVGYLLWLAAKLARSGEMGKADESRLNVSFWQGAALQFVNIKAWALALSITAGWLAGKPQFELRLLQVVLTMQAFAFASNFTYALMGSTLRGWLAVGKRLLWFNRAMAVVLVVTAIWMLRV